MTWFKKRQPRLPLLIWGAQISDGAFPLLLLFKPGKASTHVGDFVSYGKLAVPTPSFC